MMSGKNMKKKYFFPTQCYYVPSIWIRNWSVENLAVEINRIRNQHWNAEIVIIFHTVVLQRVCLVSGSRNTRDWISSHIALLNKGVYDKLVQDSYRAEGEFLGNNRGNQTQEQRHCTFSNLVPRGKLREDVRFICERETIYLQAGDGGFLIPYE